MLKQGQKGAFCGEEFPQSPLLQFLKYQESYVVCMIEAEI